MSPYTSFLSSFAAQIQMEFFTIRFAALFILLKLSNTLLYTFFLNLSRVIICSIEKFLRKILIFCNLREKTKDGYTHSTPSRLHIRLIFSPSLLFLPYPEKFSEKRGDYSGGTNENYLHIFPPFVYVFWLLAHLNCMHRAVRVFILTIISSLIFS